MLKWISSWTLFWSIGSINFLNFPIWFKAQTPVVLSVLPTDEWLFLWWWLQLPLSSGDLKLKLWAGPFFVPWILCVSCQPYYLFNDVSSFFTFSFQNKLFLLSPWLLFPTDSSCSIFCHLTHRHIYLYMPLCVCDMCVYVYIYSLSNLSLNLLAILEETMKHSWDKVYISVTKSAIIYSSFRDSIVRLGFLFNRIELRS